MKKQDPVQSPTAKPKAKAKPKSKSAPVEDPLAIPAFLRVENRKNPKPKVVDKDAPPPPPPPDPIEIAMNAVSPPAFREFIQKAVRRGHFNPEWLVASSAARRPQADVDGVLRAFRVKFDEAQEKVERGKQRLAEMRERKPKKVNPFEGMVTLKKVLESMGDKAPKRRHAIAAIDASTLTHSQYHFADAPVTLAHVVRVISSYKPPVSAKGKPEFDLNATITFPGKNPKKEGSDAFARWELLRSCSGKTVAEFLKLKGNPTTLKNAIASGKAMLHGADAGSSLKQKSEEKEPEAPKKAATKKVAKKSTKKTKSRKKRM